MRLTIPLGKGIPIEIAEDKIPALFEKLVPQVMKHMGDLQTMGVDLTPMVRKMFGAAEPIAAPATSATPAVVNAAEELEKAKAAGYWQHTDGRLYPPDLIPKPTPASPVIAVPVQSTPPPPPPKSCGSCIRGNLSTGLPSNAYSPACASCFASAERPAWTNR